MLIITSQSSTRARVVAPWTGCLLLTAAAAGLAAAQPARRVSDADLRRDAESTDDVLTWGMGYGAQRYSPLRQIDTSNVRRLAPAWSLNFAGEKLRGQEAQPIVHDGRIFITASFSRLFAVDARTGSKLWEYDYPLPSGILPCCDVVNRGAAVYDSLVYFGTLDARLVALSQRTGQVVWTQTLADYRKGYAFTAAPLVVKGMVITGVAGGEFGVVGRVDARDARTGELVWTRPVIEGFMGYFRGREHGVTGTPGATWPGDTWKTGGGATWLTPSYDPETNLLFVGTGNAGPWNAHQRKGDNLYTSSTLALNAADGTIAWHYQETPNETWDYDGVNELVLFDFTDARGRRVKAGAKADRNGFFYVLDRTNGRLRSATPFVRRMTWATRVDLVTGRPVETGNRPRDPRPTTTTVASTASVADTVFVAPSLFGGKNWMPMAYHPGTGLFYVPSNEMGMRYWNEPAEYRAGGAFIGAGFAMRPLFDDYIGALRAVDPTTGRIVWEAKHTAPLWAGVLATAGGLVFTGTTDGYLEAFDARTGRELWKFQTGSGIVAPPVTYELDGVQYVAVPSGLGGAIGTIGGEIGKRMGPVPQGGTLWVFRLPR